MVTAKMQSSNVSQVAAENAVVVETFSARLGRFVSLRQVSAEMPIVRRHGTARRTHATPSDILLHYSRVSKAAVIELQT